jgi:3-oxoacyl-[acyl-carrier protein] reductase
MKKKILLVGGTSGLGLHILNALKNNYELFVVGRRKIKKKNIRFFSVDLTKKEQIQEFIKSIENINFDIAVHCVGGSFGKNGYNLDSKSYAELFQINLLYIIDINNMLIKNMKKKNWGRIVHISSATSYNLTGGPAYSSAKAALNTYVKSMAQEFGKHGIVISSICPGPIALKKRFLTIEENKNSLFWKNFKKLHLPMGRLAKPNEIVELVNFLISKKASYSSGSVWNLDGMQK